MKFTIIKMEMKILMAGGMARKANATTYVKEPSESRLGGDTIIDDKIKNGLWYIYNEFGIDVCLVGAKLECEGQTYGVDCDVNLLVNECYNVDARGVIKGLKTGARQAMFFNKLKSPSNFFQENKIVLFGLN
ncbi:hypothetical protein Tco_1299656 [Tanacetum coccineum]